MAAEIAKTVPKIDLGDGHSIPQFGLGTWKSKPDEVRKAVVWAVKAGYRHLDCARVYENEHEIGAALKELFDEGVVKREDLFITSKCWNTFHSRSRVPQCLDLTLKELGVDYIDLYLIHWPMGFDESDGLFPEENGKQKISDVHFTETWKGMEDVKKSGKVKSIGLSNFNIAQIKEILAVAEIKPVNNQVECHPYLQQNELFEFCKANGITLTAYSPFGSPDRPWAKGDEPKPLEDPVIKAIAEKHGKSPAHVIIRFMIQRGIVVIPKSVTESRIQSNIQAFDFELSADELAKLKALNQNYRALLLEWLTFHPLYPFHDKA